MDVNVLLALCGISRMIEGEQNAHVHNGFRGANLVTALSIFVDRCCKVMTDLAVSVR